MRNGCNMSTHLATGPTAGRRRAFADAFAEGGNDLILVARPQDRLVDVADQLRSRHNIAVETLSADLAVRAEVDRVGTRLADPARPVDILVNNAGFGIHDRFTASDIDDEQQLLDVLVVAVMRLSHAALPGMIERGRGQLINVSSVAGWITGGTYSAAKAWVTVFTEGLGGELAGTGVTATAVCPGFTHTEFHERAEMDMSGLPEWLWLSADQVVRQALRDADRGRLISVAGRKYEALSLAAQYLPRPLVRRVTNR